MEKIYTVKTTKYAEAQLREIVSYVAFVLKERQTALRLLSKLETAMQSLDRMPNRVKLVDEEPWHSEGVRKLPVGNYVIFFWVDEKNSKVQITAVVYGKMEQHRVLQKMPKN